MVTLFGAVHLALVAKGRSVVSAAAQDGMHAAQVFGGTAETGRVAAERTLNLGPGLTDRTIDVAISTVNGRCDQVRVRVTARVETSVVEVFNVVSADVTGPCERFYSEPDRR